MIPVAIPTITCTMFPATLSAAFAPKALSRRNLRHTAAPPAMDDRTARRREPPLPRRGSGATASGAGSETALCTVPGNFLYFHKPPPAVMSAAVRRSLNQYARPKAPWFITTCLGGPPRERGPGGTWGKRRCYSEAVPTRTRLPKVLSWREE
jgi:hypothetical protein